MSFIACAEEYIARYEPEFTPEELFVEMARIVEMHEKFNTWLAGQDKLQQEIERMPKKKDKVLEWRKLFIHWYVERNKGRYQQEVVAELTKLVFASETTIYSILYNYR